MKEPVNFVRVITVVIMIGWVFLAAVLFVLAIGGV
jgi:hypothetical protein